jgi:hypothetical protein
MGFFYGFIRSTLLRIDAGNEERTQKRITCCVQSQAVFKNYAGGKSTQVYNKNVPRLRDIFMLQEM